MSKRSKHARSFALAGISLVLCYVAALGLCHQPVRLQPVVVEAAMTNAAGYLVRHLGPEGRFVYEVSETAPSPGRDYNILRHAGSAYALALYGDFRNDAAARDAVLRAGSYVLRRHVRPIARQNATLAVFSLPGEELAGSAAQVKLGGSALGLIALLQAHALDAAAVSLSVLRQLGNGLLFMQEPTGHFRSVYDEAQGFIEGRDSLYYPGEAILALALLHRLDRDPRWLEAAVSGIRFLARSRRGMPSHRLPNDHWLMMAIGEVLSENVDTPDMLAQRAELLAHALRLGEGMLRDQAITSWIPGLNGAFAANGSVTATSTRVEGLIALYRSLPPDHQARSRVLNGIRLGLGFVLRTQLKEGPMKGGFADGAAPWRFASEPRVRIDYVQHALAALVGYARLRQP